MTAITFISRDSAIATMKQGFPETTVLISISDTKQEQDKILDLALNNNIHSFATHFKDIDTPESGFTVETAKEMKKCIDIAINNKHDIIVHCFAGISRSGAIAKWINDHYMLGNWYLDDYKGYNRYVYEVMNEAAGVSLSAWYRGLEGKG